MAATHIYQPGDVVDCQLELGNDSVARARQWTFGFDLHREPGKGTPSGVCFELGGTGDGFAIVLDDQTLKIAAGSGSFGNTTNGLWVAAGDKMAAAARYRILVAVDAQNDRVAAWINGRHQALTGDAALFGSEWGQFWARPSAGFNATKRWTGDNDGKVGGIGGSTMSNQPPAPLRVDLANGRVTKFRIYRGQLPRARMVA